MSRVSIDDLGFAAQWLRHYDGEDDQENGAAALRVADFLDNMAAQRQSASNLRKVAKRVGRSTSEVRRVLKRRGAI